MFCCLKSCMNGFSLAPSVPIRIKENPVQLDTLHMGGQRVCGSGCALGNAPLVQNKSYFEVKLQQGGVWAVGVATRDTDLNRVHVRHSNDELYHLSPASSDSPTGELLVSTETQDRENEKPESDKECNAVMPLEGDTIGVAYDHVELNFFLNGQNMEIPIRNIRGT
ncbi:Uncharacterized protein OBRU01_08816, partial [Operophtera brumata]